MRYRPEIDGLRALAILPVMLFHAGVPMWSGGYLGVDVFFVISGYLISALLLEELSKGGLNLRRFYVRRARRLLPALLVMILACLPFAYLLLPPQDLIDFAESVGAVGLMSSNLLFWRESGYFDTSAELKPLLHTWSLAIEEQYYLIAPLALLGAWRLGQRALMGLVACVTLLSLGLAEWLVTYKPTAAFFLLPTRAWELLLGVLCALLVRRAPSLFTSPPSSTPLWPQQTLSVVGLSALIGAMVSASAETATPSLSTLSPTLGTALVILYAQRGTWVASLLSLKPLITVGLLSYSAYLWHHPMFAFYRHAEGLKLSLMSAILLMGATFVCAWLSWRFVEGPWRRSERRLWPLLSLSFVVCTFFVGLTLYREGLPERFEAIGVSAPPTQRFHDQLRAQAKPCPLTLDERLRCASSREPQRPGEPFTLILGDSHGEHLFPGLATLNPARRYVYVATKGLPSLTHLKEKGLLKALTQHQALTGERAERVILSMYFLGQFTALPLGTTYESLLEALIQALKELTSPHSLEVVLVGDVPKYAQPLQVCLNALRRGRGEAYCSSKRAHQNTLARAYREPFARLKERNKNLIIVDLLNTLCDEARCEMVREGEALMRDAHHLSFQGSQVVASVILQNLINH